MWNLAWAAAVSGYPGAFFSESEGDWGCSCHGQPTTPEGYWFNEGNPPPLFLRLVLGRNEKSKFATIVMQFTVAKLTLEPVWTPTQGDVLFSSLALAATQRSAQLTPRGFCNMVWGAEDWCKVDGARSTRGKSEDKFCYILSTVFCCNEWQRWMTPMNIPSFLFACSLKSVRFVDSGYFFLNPQYGRLRHGGQTRCALLGCHGSCGPGENAWLQCLGPCGPRPAWIKFMNRGGSV